jgi:hypothetical protein
VKQLDRGVSGRGGVEVLSPLSRTDDEDGDHCAGGGRSNHTEIAAPWIGRGSRGEIV